jgi:hypothetical protein
MDIHNSYEVVYESNPQDQSYQTEDLNEKIFAIRQRTLSPDKNGYRFPDFVELSRYLQFSFTLENPSTNILESFPASLCNLTERD